MDIHLTNTTISSNPHSSHSTFPFIAIAIIGILATALLLISYYIFIIKSCFNWRRIIFLTTHFRSHREEPLTLYTSPTLYQGLDENTIRSIPISKFNIAQIQPTLCECAVCLNEFQQDEPLRVIPNCAHMFYIDCIDVWLQRNSNCPICRTSISTTTLFSPLPNHAIDTRSDPDFIVNELHDEINEDGSLLTMQEISGSSDLHEKLEVEIITKTGEKKKEKGKKYGIVLSMGDECIINRGIKDEEFSIQPIRRSFSMDSAIDRQLYLAVQEIIQHKKINDIDEVSLIREDCINNRVYNSFFSFGHGRGSQTSVFSTELGLKCPKTSPVS